MASGISCCWGACCCEACCWEACVAWSCGIASGALSTVMRQWSWNCGRTGHGVSREHALGVAAVVSHGSRLSWITSVVTSRSRVLRSSPLPKRHVRRGRDEQRSGRLEGPRGSVAGSGSIRPDGWPHRSLMEHGRCDPASSNGPRVRAGLEGVQRRHWPCRQRDACGTVGTIARFSGKVARMWYAIEGFDGADVLAQRTAARPEHLARLHALRDAGRLLLTGPCPAIDAEDPGPAGFSGSIVIAEFPSLADARAWAAEDPYVAAGVYQRVEVRPFRRVLP